MKTYAIKEIKEILFEEKQHKRTQELVEQLAQDERKGVQKLLQKYHREQEKQQQLRTQFEEMSTYEFALRKQGTVYIAGIDEVGRGPLAGPVVAAAVILPKDFYLLGLTDSKKLSKLIREQFYEQIVDKAIATGIGVVSAKEIDEINIYQATKKAMNDAVQQLAVCPEHLLIDAMDLSTPLPQTSLVKGDQKSISIAASSVIAKVTRDRYMEKLARTYPAYHFEKHMGYGTKEHLDAIEQFGVTPEHRLSFRPLKDDA
ncbi:ribonuclease HII [Desertibacillus haloalkaliphilus]|uniref:ribonuclease HII n=1 Tax=Desertibacillus haloalkaliphilus TaxID=1328930 RepID=UPI001C2710D8|nr:ribonuclease HII [Desertibacillus haloalkaliphilus]MBU8907031.1 ribonuclease HII [Desertibacillus haloalkaliphilus]